MVPPWYLLNYLSLQGTSWCDVDDGGGYRGVLWLLLLFFPHPAPNLSSVRQILSAPATLSDLNSLKLKLSDSRIYYYYVTLRGKLNSKKSCAIYHEKSQKSSKNP